MKASTTTKNNGRSSTIIGQNVSAGIISFRGADLTVAKYIGHAEIGTRTEDIQNLLSSHNVDIVSLDKLVTKHDRFASFKLVMKKSQLSIVEDPTIWPSGISVGRWWDPKAPLAPTGAESE